MKQQEVIDYGWDAYMKSFDELSYVDVGILAQPRAKKRPPNEDGKQTDITLAELAAIQEYGTEINVTDKMRGYLSANGLHLSPDTTIITTPSRPFMRQTFDEQESNIAKIVDELNLMIIEGKISKKDALERLGQMHKQDIQKAMSTKGKFKENHPFTVERKKSSQPLIDKGLLRQAIDYEVG